nr:hypothetical protein [uncultured Carboxylicivirga sp.]
MGITKPYKRIYRPVNPKLSNAGYSSWAYIIDKEYCKSGHSYVRAFLLILEDLEKLFEYIEPSAESFNSFSFRIHELFMRTCIEIEANFKAILNENSFEPDLDRFKNPIYNIRVYKKVNSSHHLSDYEVGLPQWATSELIKFRPFKAWSTNNQSLEWYQAYNMSKHDRHDNFKYANLGNLLNAVSGLLCLIHSQFRSENFSASEVGLSASGYDFYEMESSTGGVFRIKEPTNWTEDELYEFDWSDLENEEERFQKYNYNN